MKHFFCKSAVLTISILFAISFVSCGNSSTNSDVEDLDKLFPGGILFLSKNGQTVGVKPNGEIADESEYAELLKKGAKYSEGLARVGNTFIDEKGNEVIKLEYPKYSPFDDNPYHKYINYNEGENGETWFYDLYISDDKKESVIYDSSSIIKLHYIDAHDFHDGRSRVSVRCIVRNNKSFVFHRFIDKKGNIITPDYDEKYSIVSDYSDGYAVVYDKGSHMFLDTTGKYITTSYLYDDIEPEEGTPLKFYHAESFRDGFAVVGRRDNKYGTKYGVINRNFECVIPYNYIREIKNLGNGIFYFQYDYKCNSHSTVLGIGGCMDSTGKRIYPIGHSVEDEFSDGLVVTYDYTQYHKYGYYDNKGNLVIPFEYDKVKKFDHGVAHVWRDESDWYINTKNEEIPLPKTKYDKINEYYRGLAIVENHTLFGVIDATGTEIVPPEYDHIVIDDNGFIWVCLKGRWGVVSRKNKILIPIEFDNPFK